MGSEHRIKGNLPCALGEDGGCGSSDAMSLYFKNNQYDASCFSCGASGFLPKDLGEELAGFKGHQQQQTKRNKMTATNVDEMKGSYRPLDERNIKEEVCRAFGVKTQLKKGSESVGAHLYPYFDKQGVFLGHKTRLVESKKFPWEGGDSNKITLFGQQMFPKGSARILTLTEGELDAMSAYQMSGSKYPCVSLPFGAASVKKALQNPAIHDYLSSFEKIVVSFDMDDAGQTAAKEFCEAFPAKAFIMDMKYKDANEYLQLNKGADFMKAWWAAAPLPPAGLVPSSELMREVLEDTIAQDTVPFIYEGVDDLMFGVRRGELTTIVAGTGVGKSAVIREIAYDIAQQKKNAKVGVIMLEESNQKTATGLVGIQMSKPLLLLDLDAKRPPHKRILKDLAVTKEERELAVEKTLGSNQFIFYKNSFTSNTIETIVNKVRQMATVYGCEYIFLDHISIIVSGQDQDEDERKALDKIMTQLRNLVEETKVHLFVVSHLRRPQGKGHEQGAATSVSDIRGTAGIAQLSDNILGLERNQQAESKLLRNTTILRVLKCRVTGMTGPAAYLDYDIRTGRLSEITEDEYLTRQGKDDKKDESNDPYKNAPVQQNQFETFEE